MTTRSIAISIVLGLAGIDIQAQIPKPLQEQVEIPHSLETDVPGEVAPVCWGWLGTVYYQHVPETGVGPDYFKQRVIDEPWKWGANLVEIYSTNWINDCKGHHLRPMSLSDMKGGEPFEHCPDPRWTNDSFRNLYRYLHARGMITGLFACERLVPDPGAHPFISTDPAIIRKNLQALEALALQFSDCLTQDPSEMLDGFGWECWFHDNAGRTSEAVWSANPGMYVYSTAVWPQEPPPNYLHGFMCAVPPQYIRGRDDQRGFPEDLGRIPLTYQADCRARKQTHPAWEPWSPFTGGTYPDWILKQAEDFFRRTLYTGGKPDAQAIWWLGEPEALLPNELRPYVYAASMDPIRHAATTALWVSGKGGLGDCVDAATDIGVASRYEVPFDAAYIGNNHLRLYREIGRDAGHMMTDPTHTGHFDNDSIAESLFLGSISSIDETDEPEEILVTQTPAEVIVPVVRPYDAATSPEMTNPIWSVGAWNASPDDLRGEGGYETVESFIVGEPADRFPSILAVQPRGPSEIHIAFESDASSAELLVGQITTSRPEQVQVRLDGKPIGHFHTRTEPRNQTVEAWCHRLGPFDLSSRQEHVLQLIWDGTGDGFALDAVALCHSDKPAVPVKKPDYPQRMQVDWTSQAKLPSGMSSAEGLPKELTLIVDLVPGRYQIRMNDVKAASPSAYTMLVDGDFGPGFGLPAGGFSETETLSFTIHKAGQHKLTFVDRLNGLSEVVWSGLSLLREHNTCIRHTFDEPGGHFAQMTETITREGFVEERTYTMINDFPAVQIDVRWAGDLDRPTNYILPFSGDTVEADGATCKQGEFELKGDARCWTLKKEGHADVVLDFNEYPAGTRLSWRKPNLKIRFPAGVSGYSMRIGVNTGQYAERDFLTAVRAAMTAIPVEQVPVTLKNDSAVPLVRVLKIDSPPEGPYMVRETGADGVARWIARGAQPSITEDSDYLRVYLQPEADAVIRRFGLIDDLVGPAPGNQNSIAISKIDRHETTVRATIRVMKISPMLFAPSVKFANTIAEAKLDGRAWAYFQGKTLHLPQRRGDHDIEVTFGTPSEPHLMRTSANVTRAEVGDGRLRIEWSLPPWSESMPGDLDFTFAIDGIDAPPNPAEGYEISRTVGARAILAADTEELAISFRGLKPENGTQGAGP